MEYRAPRTLQERTLCSLFSDILGVSRVGIHDNFFELGGHSLLAARLLRKIRAVAGVELSLRSIFASPTVAEIVEQLCRGVDQDPLASLLPLRLHGHHPALFCVHPAGGLSWSYAGFVPYVDGPIYGLQAHGLNRKEILPQTVEEMACSYLEQIRSIQADGPYHLLGWSFGGLVAHAMAVILQRNKEGVALLALLDAFPSFNRTQSDIVPSEREIFGMLLPSLRYEFEDTSDRSAWREHLQDAGTTLDVLEEHHFSALIEIFKNNIRLARRFVPQTFAGDAIVFASTADRNGNISSPEISWKPYISGLIKVYPVVGKHDRMMQAPALAEIGPIVAAELAAAGASE